MDDVISNYMELFFTFFEFKKNGDRIYLEIKGLERSNQQPIFTAVEVADLLAVKFDGKSYGARAIDRDISKAAVIDNINRVERKLRKIANNNEIIKHID